MLSMLITGLNLKIMIEHQQFLKHPTPFPVSKENPRLTRTCYDKNIRNNNKLCYLMIFIFSFINSTEINIYKCKAFLMYSMNSSNVIVTHAKLICMLLFGIILRFRANIPFAQCFTSSASLLTLFLRLTYPMLAYVGRFVSSS